MLCVRRGQGGETPAPCARHSRPGYLRPENRKMRSRGSQLRAQAVVAPEDTSQGFPERGRLVFVRATASPR